MGGKLSLLMLVLFISTAVFIPADQGFLAPVYPGAASHVSDGETVFLAEDSFEAVFGFYAAHSSLNPDVQRDRISGGSSAFFRYGPGRRDHPTAGKSYFTKDDGVYVSFRANSRSQAVRDAFQNMRALVQSGIMEEREFKALENSYSYLQYCYFPPTAERDRSGKPIHEDSTVFHRYYALYSRNGYVEALQAKVEQYMKEGKHAEMGAAAEEMMKLMMGQVDPKNPPPFADRRAVEGWENCLKELEKAAFSVRIFIGRNPPRWEEGYDKG